MISPFLFTITEFSRLLGKSPVTVRGWERKGLIAIPRDSSGDRKLSTDDIRDGAKRAFELRRISEERLQIIHATVTLLQVIERENNAANRT